MNNMVELGRNWCEKINEDVYRSDMLEQICDIDTVVNTPEVKKTHFIVIFHFVAFLLVTNQEKGIQISINSKTTTTHHKQAFTSSCSRHGQIKKDIQQRFKLHQVKKQPKIFYLSSYKLITKSQYDETKCFKDNYVLAVALDLE